MKRLFPLALLSVLAGCAGGPFGTVTAGQVGQPPTQEPGAPPDTGVELSAASRSLLAESRDQQRAGQTAMAAATIERAIRIDPQHPQPWIELGRLRLAEGQYPQAESLARKALALAGRDADAQAQARELLEAVLRARP